MTTFRDPRIDTGPPRDPAGDEPGPSGLTAARTSVTNWLVVVAILGIVVLAVLVVALRNDVQELRQEVTNLSATRGSESAAAIAALQTSTVPPTLDLPPADAESARRQINDTYRVVFDPASPVAVRTALVPGGQAAVQQLVALSGGRCAGARTVVTDVRFSSDDEAAVAFRFEGSGVPIADGVVFHGGTRRSGAGWQVTPESITSVVDMAKPYCGG